MIPIVLWPPRGVRDLTMSFRFAKQIANLASIFIREAKVARRFLSPSWGEAR